MSFKNAMMTLALCLPAFLLTAQGAKAPDNWFTLDKAKDGVQGASSDEALKQLKAKGKKGQTVIVAVLDSGVDYPHEDLKDIMWVNPGEIPNNGKDDDNNGYVDDIHGWNFLGGPGGSVGHETLELTREYVRLSKKFGNSNGKNLSGADKKEYEYYQGIKSAYEESRSQAEAMKTRIEEQFVKIEASFKAVQKATGKTSFSAEDLDQVNADGNDELKAAVDMSKKLLAQGLSPEGLEEEKERSMSFANNQLNYSLNPDYNPRTVVGDDPNDLSNRFYGSNEYIGPDAFHGTHVAGIIAAIRNNDKGINGVADNVRIMTVRCVPDGDERDKDVANAIRYAVDNGASIINMSFGKGYSPQKAYVDAAVKYAAEHDVLLVHAAGNDSENNDTSPNFPNDNFEKKGLFKPKTAPNWLEIGALNWRSGENSPARFSNYGKKNVDFFSPGVALYSTIPGGGYGNASGTSMAAPAAAGVAAILRSYYPDLSAKQVREILMKSVVKRTDEVYKPGTTQKVPFSDLSAAGGVVSTTNAVALAEKTPAKKHKTAIWRDAGMGKNVKAKTKAVTP